MKRVLFGLVALAMVALPGLGQLSGEWSTTISLLPAPALKSTSLTLAYTFNSWTVTSSSDFTGMGGWVWQEFSTLGAFGPLELDGTLLFGPVIPAFLYAQIITKVTLAGLDIGLYTAMLGEAVGGTYFPPGPTGGAAVKVTVPLGDVAKLTASTGFGASVPEDGFTIHHVSGLTKTYATSPYPGGLAFTYALLAVEGLPLCCGITFDLEFSFLKSGFDYIEFLVKDAFAICCGISFDLGVKFTTTAKTLRVTPKFAGFGEACFEVYGNVVGSGMYLWEGIRVDGFKIQCTLAECNYVEFLTALDPEAIEEILDEDIFEGDEFEYVKLGFCGAGCCGGQYTVDIAIYFQPSGSLFGISRLGADMTIPIMANFTGEVGFDVGTDVALDVGWTFTF